MKKSYSKTVEYVKFKEIITGQKAKNNTMKWDVDGTDLGIPVYSQKENNLWLFFGDTFNTPFPSDSNWRGTVIGKITNFNPEEPFKFDTFVLDENKKAKDLIIAHHSTQEELYERTKICQGAVEVDGIMYAFYESIRFWGEPGWWDCNYGGAIKSIDGGVTWERVYDLTWVESNEGEFANKIKELAEQDINLKPSGIDLSMEERVSKAFMQLYPIDGKDGYIYLYGRHAGRQYGITCARAIKENIEKFKEYEYLLGFNDSKPIWSKGVEGLKELNNHEFQMISAPVSNMSVIYNNYLGKWMCVYFKPGYGIVYNTALTPYGPYNDCEVILGNDYPFPCGKYIYGGFTHELLSKDNGQKIYLLVSQWTDILYGVELYEVKFK